MVVSKLLFRFAEIDSFYSLPILGVNYIYTFPYTGGVFFILYHILTKSIMENIFEEQVKDELKSMDQRLYELEEKMTSIDKKLTQVVDAILGNPLTKNGGFVNETEAIKARMKELEMRLEKQDLKLEKQEEFKKRIIWTISVVVAAALIIQYFIGVYSNLRR